MKVKKKQKYKFDWILYFVIVGWTVIVAIWVWQAIKQCIIEDCSKGIFYFVVAAIFLFIGIKSIRDHLKKKKIELKKK